MIWAWLIAGGTVLGAQPLARDVELTVHTFPPSQIFLLTPTGESLLGYSGQPTRVSPPVIRNRQGVPVQYASGTLLLRAEDHAEQRVSISGSDWASGRLPSQGSYRLPASSFLVGLLDWVKVYPLASLSGLALLLLGGAAAFRWRSTARATSAEVKALHSRLETTGDPLLGKLLGRYQVEARLGQGGMGSVYQVSDEVGVYAAKVIYFEALDSQSVDRFRREFKLLSQLRHPAFPRCFDYQEKDSMAFQVMELVKGRTLRELVRPAGIPWAEVRPWVLAILDGLHCAHSQGIVHRDLKPENIMANGEQVKILDFGIARQTQLTAITMTGQAFGTPKYIAPEQVYGSSSEVDARTDLYSLGIILYELLSGCPPFQAEEVQELVALHLNAPPPRLQAKGVPAGMADVIEVLLAKNPANRYASAQRVKEVLSGLEDEQESSSEPASEGTMALPRRRTPEMATPSPPLGGDDDPSSTRTIAISRRPFEEPPSHDPRS